MESDIVVAVRNIIPPPLPFLIAGLFAVCLVWNKNQEIASGSQKSVSDSAVPQTSQTVLALVEPGDYAAGIAVISERPLFSRTRRNPELISNETSQDIVSQEKSERENDEDEIEVSEQAQIEEPPQPPRLNYLGYMEQNGTPSALIKLSEKNEEEWVYAGTEIEGWILKSISKSRIYLTQRTFEHFVDINL